MVSKYLHECGISKWDIEYTNMGNEEILHLIIAADYLDIAPLLELMCAKLASVIRGMTPEEIYAQNTIDKMPHRLAHHV